MKHLIEDKRSQLISVSKNGANYAQSNQQYGKNRYQRRLKSRIANSVVNYNKIDMNQLFKDDILNIDIEVKGETNSYLVKFSFSGFLDRLHAQLKNSDLDIRSISRALVASFNDKDVYVSCSCPDFYYRFSYWDTVNDVTSAAPQMIPSPITNPNDDKGAGCKHILLCLSNTSWILKVASVINNYIIYMKSHYQKLYADIIYPAIYEKEYEDDVQQDLFGSDLDSSQNTLDASNKYSRERTQFKKDNPYRFKPNNNSVYKGQISFDDTIEDDNVE